ncbi:ATP-binding protein [Anaerosinus sp.]
MNFIRAIAMLCIIAYFNLFCSFSYASEAVDESKVVRVGLLDYSTFMEEKDGLVMGYAYEYLVDISRYANWDYEFVPGTWEECLERLEKGEIDLLASAQYTADRADLYDYSTMPMGVAYTVLCSLNGQDYAFNDFNEYKDLVVGVLEGSIRSKEYEKICKSYGFEPKLLYFNTHEEQMEALKKGRINAVLISSIRCDKGLNIIASFNLNNYYFIVNKNRKQILWDLNKAQAKIHFYNPYYEADLYKKYYGSIMTKSNGFSAEEKEYIQNKGTITVVALSKFPPIQYCEEEENVNGIVTDVLQEILYFTGLKVKYLIVDNHFEAIKAIQEGKADVWAACYDDFDAADAFNLELSKPFLKLYQSMIQNKNKKSATEDTVYAVTPYYKDWFKLKGKKIILYDTMLECIQAVNDGIADVTFASYYIVEYFMKDPRLDNLIVSNLDGKEIGLAFAVNKQNPEQLTNILNKGIDSIPQSRMQEITYNHLLKENKNLEIIQFIYKYPIQIIVLLCTFFLGLSMIFYYKSQHKSLKKGFQEKEIYELNLQRALIRAEHANAAKTDFLSRMSHEIRTPIGAIIGFNEKAEQNIEDKEKVLDCIQKIKVSSNHLLQLINDILDMTKVSAGKMELNIQPINIMKMMQSVQVVYEEIARKNEISFTVDIDTDLDRYVMADELRLKQIIINLISNAIKYNKSQGTVEIKVRKIADLEEKISVHFSIMDTGVGIAEENLAVIFHPFEREKTVIRKMIAGTGLGLSISSKIAMLMNSKLEVISKLDKGSTFWFDIDFEVVDKNIEYVSKENTVQHIPDYKGKRFLIVEDNDLNAEIIGSVLGLTKATLDYAVNGQEACILFELSPHHYYDAVFMDIMMPIMDGYAATMYIRNLARPDAKSILIIALSANAFEDDKERSLIAGMNEHCVKPIEKQGLFNALNKYLK